MTENDFVCAVPMAFTFKLPADILQELVNSFNKQGATVVQAYMFGGFASFEESAIIMHVKKDGSAQRDVHTLLTETIGAMPGYAKEFIKR